MNPLIQMLPGCTLINEFQKSRKFRNDYRSINPGSVSGGIGVEAISISGALMAGIIGYDHGIEASIASGLATYATFRASILPYLNFRN